MDGVSRSARCKRRKRETDPAWVAKVRADALARYHTKYKLDPVCMATKAAAQRKYRADNPLTQKSWAARTLPLIKHRAKKAGIPFSITVADVEVPVNCPVFGIPLTFGKGTKSPHSPSIDRIVPSLGYVPGNVAVISRRANSIKHNANSTELYAVAKWAESVGC